MKTSLGRRSSSRNPHRAFADSNTGGCSGNVRQERKSGIPLRRAASTDRGLATPLTKNMLMVTPMTKRSNSEDRNSMITYSTKKPGFGGGTERPSRATTLSTNSARLSSYGGARSKRDNRPIEDKDWQLGAQKRIENFLRNDPEGCEMLGNNCSIRPITGKMFISIVDLLLRRMDGENRTYIHKDNYITELPFIMKKLLYRGKIEKSWLITVNTVRSWSHVLALLDFLVSCVMSQMVIDPLNVMFPEQYDKDEEVIWDYKLLLEYFHKSYAVYKRQDSNYEEIQEQFDREVIEIHASKDNVFERITTLQCDIKRLKQEREAMTVQYEKVKQCLQSLGDTFESLKNEKSQYEEYISSYNKFTEDSKNKLENMDRHIEKLSNELECTLKKKLDYEKLIANQQLSQCQLAELRQRRDSLQREIKREQEYISTYEGLAHQNSLEVLGLKKKVDDIIKNYNIQVIKYLPFEFDNALDAKCEEEWNKRLDIVQDAINSAKVGLQTLSDSSSCQQVTQMQQELNNLEKKLADRRAKLKAVTDKMVPNIKEKEDFVRKLRKEFNDLSEKFNNMINDPEDLSILEEKIKLADKKEKQLDFLRNNAVYIISECQKVLQEYNHKNKVMDEELMKLKMK